MGLISEFKAFALRGNVVDMAVGVIIGAAFGKIVATLVDKVMMPPIGMLTGGVDFSKLKLVIQEGVTDATGKVTTPEVAIGYGEFLNAVIQFIIVAFVLFMVIKAMNSAKKKEPPPPPPGPTPEQKLLGEIRDALIARR
jgi:large conductance mechanosensitive channel